jgi:hypothetical protein
MNQKNLLALSIGMLAAAIAPRASAQLFTPGDLVVSTYGDTGTPTASGNYTDGVPTPITLDELSTSGNLVLSDTLPVADSGSNFGIVGEYGSSSEGTIQLSGNDEYLTIGGYSATPSFANAGGPAGGYSNADGVALAQSTSANVPRVVAVIDADGNVNSSSIFNDIYSTENIRSVYSPDGSTLYLSGQSSNNDAAGIYLTSVGTNTVANPSDAPTTIYGAHETRTVTEVDGNLYFSLDRKNKATGVFMYSGLPSSGSAVPTELTPANNGLSGANAVNYSPEGFFFANSTTLYVADTGDPKAGGTGDGGIQKWTFNGSAWTLQYTLTDPNFVPASQATTVAHGQTGFEALTGSVVGNTVNLYAVSYTAFDTDPNGVYSITDNLNAVTPGAGETFDELAASGSDDLFKGISFAPIPEPADYALIAAASAGLFVLVLRRREANRAV